MPVETKHGLTKISEKEDRESRFTKEANAVLRELGNEIGQQEIKNEHMQYIGSAAVHIYHSNNLGVSMFIAQASTLGKCPEVLASQAFDNLQAQMREQFRKIKA